MKSQFLLFAVIAFTNLAKGADSTTIIPSIELGYHGGGSYKALVYQDADQKLLVTTKECNFRKLSLSESQSTTIALSADVASDGNEILTGNAKISEEPVKRLTGSFPFLILHMKEGINHYHRPTINIQGETSEFFTLVIKEARAAATKFCSE